MSEKKLNGTVIVTYRCNARCSMCNRYKAPSKPDEEISIETIKKLPKMYFTNITGGEPFIRTDLKDIVRELYKKSDRIVISTNGFFTDRIVDLAKEFPQIGIRISIEGLEKTNNEIRGLENGFQRGYGTLKKLREMGMKDVGFGMTVQDKNAPDLVPLYELSNEMGMEFATASLHNSFYFVEAKNIINDRPMVAKNFENLVNELLKSNSPKKWFRAYFNHGLINYIYGQKRLLPCDMSFDTFFIDPYGDVMPCNGTKDKEVNIIVNAESKVGKNCMLHGDNCIGNNGKTEGCPIIGDNVDIGTGAKILGNIQIANGVKIGAGAVVVKSCLTENATIVGIPAKEIDRK